MLRTAALMFFVVFQGVVFAQTEPASKPKSKEEQLTYDVAYRKAQEEKKPLVVLVGAEWCAACKTMKNDTIAPMKASGQFKEVVYTQIDKDSHPELAQQIMQGNTLPQIVVFCESDKGWKKFSLTGMQTAPRVKELMKRAFDVLPPRR